MDPLLVAGCYERFLFGFSCGEAPALERKFCYPAHKGPIKCTAAAPPFIVSGGADDTVHVYNAQTQADLGFLMSPGEGAVSAAAFHTPPAARLPTHLFSGTADGGVCVWRAGGSWDCLKTMTGHTKEVTSLAVHPSGRLLLSAARDSMLRLWNLVKGRCQYKTRLGEVAEVLELCPSGAAFVLLSSGKVALHDLEAQGAAAVSSVSLARRGMCLQLLSERVRQFQHMRQCPNTHRPSGSAAAPGSGEGSVGQAQSVPCHKQYSRLMQRPRPGQEAMVGLEDGSLSLWDLRSGESVLSAQRAHASRVRGVARLGGPATPASACSEGLLGSASADGVVRVWDLRRLAAQQPTPVAEASTTARLTCLCAVPAGAPAARAEPAAPAGPGPGSRAEAAQGAVVVKKSRRGGEAKPGLKLPAGYLAVKRQRAEPPGQALEPLAEGQREPRAGAGRVKKKARRREGAEAAVGGPEKKGGPGKKGAGAGGQKGAQRTQATAAAAQSGIAVPGAGVVEFPDVEAPGGARPQKRRKKGSRERRAEAQQLAERAEDFLL